MPVRIGVINVCDRASSGVYEDTPGKACVVLLLEWLSTPFDVGDKVSSGDSALIESALSRMADVAGCCLIVTTGGTGPAQRDVTPDRKSTRLNSSHLVISYAVFCLKKKN